jgi:GNAT superfamily N-acetyltransferase
VVPLLGPTTGRRKVNKLGQITLREAGTEDAVVVLRLMQAAFEEYEGVLDPPSGANKETIDTVRRKLAGGAAVMATVADEPVGFAFYEAADELLYFGRLSVLPQWRNNGIGIALLDYVEQRARQTGAAGVRLGVRLQLPHLVARYERRGYRITKYMTHAGYAEPTYVYMEKRFQLPAFSS